MVTSALLCFALWNITPFHSASQRMDRGYYQLALRHIEACQAGAVLRVLAPGG